MVAALTLINITRTLVLILHLITLLLDLHPDTIITLAAVLVATNPRNNFKAFSSFETSIDRLLYLDMLDLATILFQNHNFNQQSKILNLSLKTIAQSQSTRYIPRVLYQLLLLAGLIVSIPPNLKLIKCLLQN